MATIPDWKLQLLARRRQEEAAVRGREKAERDRLSQMPAWKRGLLERRRAKLGLPPGNSSPVPETAESGPPDPDESAVLLEAIGPVHQNRFIRQERQQQQQWNDDPPPERKPGTLESRERRPSPGDPRDHSPKGREGREERLSPREARERRLGTGGEAHESSPRPSEARDLRPSPGEVGDRSTRLVEGRKWRPSLGETCERSLRLSELGEQSPRRKAVVESRLSPGESGNQMSLTEAHKWRPDSTASQEQSLVPLEAAERRRLDSGEERKDCGEARAGTNQKQIPGKAPGEIPETLTREAQDSISRGAEPTERRPSPVGDGERDSRPTEGWKWTLSSGKSRERTPRDTETQSQKTEPPESAEKRPEQGVGAGGGVSEKEEAGAQSWSLSASPIGCSASCPLPPEDAGPRGPRLQEEEAVALQPPPPPAPAAPQPSGDPLMSRLFYGVKAGPGVGAPRRSGHTFTVNPRRSVAPASPATAAAPATGDAVPGAGKKRYPTAEEILVLGGYLRLSRSCLVKGSPERHHKQLKISFSETALETTYQYPSESSVLEELGPDLDAPSTPNPPADEEEEEEDLLLLQPELQGGLRTKALIVDESCRR